MQAIYSLDPAKENFPQHLDLPCKIDSASIALIYTDCPHIGAIYRKNSETTLTAQLAGQPDDGSMKSNCESTKAQIGLHLLEPRRGCAVRGIALNGLPAETF